MISSPGKKLNIVLPLAMLLAIVLMPFAGTDDALAQETSDGRSPNPYLVETLVDEDERLIDKVIVPGRPPEIKAAAATVPEPDPAMGINTISKVPAFNWSYGCSATAAAMLFGHYDNTGYSNMYAGPTNGGVCPMDNSIWGPGIAGSPGECPLSATHKGKDKLEAKGHVDDYWASYASSAPDPFIGNWAEHSYGDCTGDYMGTNQSLLDNNDGETTFYYYTSGAPLPDYTGCEPDERDGCHGLRLFAESRGYTVITNYSQYIKGQGSDENKGFTFADFQSEIDAGRPVFIQVQGHTMLGYGYNTSDQTVYIHDTWDRSSHSMTWGGTYQGRQHFAVAVIQLATPNRPPNMPSNPSPANYSTSVSIDASLSWSGGDPDAGDTVTYDVYFGTSGSVTRVSDDQSASTYDPATLKSNTEYSWKIVARDNHGAATVGPLWDFTTGPATNSPPQLSSPSVQPPSGGPSTGFSYFVNYYDSDGDSPSVGQVYVDNIPYAMSLHSGADSDGVYRYGPEDLSIENHSYYFYFEDGKGGVARLPASGAYPGPVVTPGNNLPNLPSMPSPTDNATGVSVDADLSWTGGDPDAGDTVTYDVYFGTSASPPLVSDGQTTTIYGPGPLSYNTKHYWKIVATDNHEAQTTGPLWDFSTQTAVSLVTWNCPLGGQSLIAPYPSMGRPFLTADADPAEINVAPPGEELWGIYWLDEATGDWLYYIPGFASTLTMLELDQYYYVVVSNTCALTIPQ